MLDQVSTLSGVAIGVSPAVVAGVIVSGSTEVCPAGVSWVTVSVGDLNVSPATLAAGVFLVTVWGGDLRWRSQAAMPPAGVKPSSIIGLQIRKLRHIAYIAESG